MNGITAAFPNRKLHVILDNLNTHKKNEHWLKAHPNVRFHFTPTSASKVEPFAWTRKKSPSTQIQRPPYHSALIPMPGNEIAATTPDLLGARPSQPCRY